MKKAISLFLAFITLAVCFASCGPVQYEDIDLSDVPLEQFEETDEETDYVIINVKNYGKIVIRLFPKVAPETVKNFKKLVSEKFYDGIIFHRVIEGFMIQGGYPDGFGGSDATIKGEFTQNGFENNLKHTRGVVSMARTNDPDSASSQFFICQEAYDYGNGKYAAFGYVVAGMEVVDAIASCDVNSNDRPLDQVVMETVRFAQVKK